MLRAIACLGLSACLFVVTKERSDPLDQSVVWGAPVMVAPPIPVVSSQQAGTAVDALVVWRTVCDTPGTVTTRYRTSRHASLAFVPESSGGGNPIAIIAFAILTAPITLPISGIVTMIRLAGDDDRITTQPHAAPPKREPCDLPAAGVQVLVSAPGRDAVTVMTGPDGRAHAELGDATAAQTATVTLVPR